LEEELDEDAHVPESVQLYSICLSKETLEYSGGFNIWGNVVFVVKYIGDLVVLAEV